MSEKAMRVLRKFARIEFAPLLFACILMVGDHHAWQLDRRSRAVVVVTVLVSLVMVLRDSRGRRACGFGKRA